MKIILLSTILFQLSITNILASQDSCLKPALKAAEKKFNKFLSNEEIDEEMQRKKVSLQDKGSDYLILNQNSERFSDKRTIVINPSRMAFFHQGVDYPGYEVTSVKIGRLCRVIEISELEYVIAAEETD